MRLRESQSNKKFLNQTMVIKHPQLMNLGGLFGREGVRVMLRTHSMAVGEEEAQVEVRAGADLQ